MSQSEVYLVECPRDAMQGWDQMIPTSTKVEYLNALLQVGFDSLDFGSFVSPKAIPQMADTSKVVKQLNRTGSKSKLLAIVANVRGAEEALQFDAIDTLGFPLSVSETFQQRNANSSIEQGYERIQEIRQLSSAKNKGLIVYLSMAFGNPYGDTYGPEIVFQWAEKLKGLGLECISVADTIGIAEPPQISAISAGMVSAVGEQSFGLHLHSTPDTWKAKAEAAWEAGCRRFDGALLGIGGCPMASDSLTGNINTEYLVRFFKSRNAAIGLDEQALQHCLRMAAEIFHYDSLPKKASDAGDSSA